MSNPLCIVRTLAGCTRFSAALTRRTLSSGTMPAAPLFGGDTAELYAKIFEQHAHPDGPWKLMISAARGAFAPSGAGNLLDIASGPGEPGILIAQEMPGVHVVCTDISVDMVNKARTRSAHLANVRCEVVDAQDLSAFADNEFDAITICYGAMFIPEPMRALSEARRVLRPGGLFIATFWIDMPMMEINKVAMEAVLKAPPPPPEMNPLSLKEDGLFERMLKDAGFEVTEKRDSAYPLDFGPLDGAHRLALLPSLNTLSALSAERADEDVMGTARAATERVFVERGLVQPSGHVVLTGNRFRLVVARAL